MYVLVSRLVCMLGSHYKILLSICVADGNPSSVIDPGTIAGISVSLAVVILAITLTILII